MKFGKIIKSACAMMLMLSCNIAGTLPVHAADSELIGVRAGILDFVDDPWNSARSHRMMLLDFYLMD